MREKIGIRFSCRNKRWGQNAPFREKRLTATPTVGEVDKLCGWGQNKRKIKRMGSIIRILAIFQGNSMGSK